MNDACDVFSTLDYGTRNRIKRVPSAGIAFVI